MSRAPSPVQLARQHASSGRLDDAVALLMRHLRQSPKDVQATMELALLLVKLGNRDRAEFYFSRAVELAPQISSIRSDHGHALMILNRPKEAIARFQEALKLDPAMYAASTGLAQCLVQIGDVIGAITAAEEGIRHSPNFPDVYDNLSRARLLMGDSAGAIEAARRGLAVAPDNQRLRASLAVAFTYAPDIVPSEVAGAYAANGQAMAAHAAPPPIWQNKPDPNRPLRIGYLSADLREHSVAFYMEPILANHDPAANRIFCYSTALEPDATSARLKSLVTARGGVWIETPRFLPEVLSARMRADQIDILIELGGHSFGNKLVVIPYRPAPILVEYLGWAATSGLPMMDWRIVDSITDPPGYESHSTERLARLEGCFVCYAGLRDAPDPGPPADGPSVFGSFNAITKINSACIRAWAAAMNFAPGSRMILKASQLEYAPIRDRITAQFAAHGIDASRLEFLPRISDAKQHLQTYSRIGVALDTFPYNGTTTTCEALWMGVPVVTLEGNMHAGRVGKSILTSIGLPEWCAPDERAFAQTASSLALNRAKLAELRGTLRPRMQASPLCDPVAFTRKLESAYRDMWRVWCSSRSAT